MKKWKKQQKELLLGSVALVAAVALLLAVGLAFSAGIREPAAVSLPPESQATDSADTRPEVLREPDANPYGPGDFSFENDDTQEVTLSENEWKSRLSYTLYCQEYRELKCIQDNLFPYMQPAAVAKLQKIANLYLEYLKNSIKPQERPIEPKRTAQTLSTDVPLPREVIVEGYQTSVKRAFADCKTDFEIGKTLHELQCKGWLTNDKPRKAYYRFIRKFCYKRFDDSNADKGYRSI